MILEKLNVHFFYLFRTLFVPELVLGLVVVMSVQAAPKLAVTNLRVEYKTNPVGIVMTQPRLSWEIVSPERGTMQSAYRIQVASNEKALKRGKNLLWDSGKVESGQSNQVVYAGPGLQSGQRRYWRVRVWNQKNKDSKWSQAAFWEMGLLNASDWKADWIQSTIKEDVSKSNPAQMFRKTFKLKGAVASARAYISALGLYEANLNGVKIGDQVLTPGWTSYDTRLQYQTYNLTKMLRAGENAIGVTVGDGWFRGNLGFRGQRNVYGEKLGLIVQITVQYTDGTSEIIGTDGSWKSTTGPILMSDIYNGETYDAQLEKTGWCKGGFDDSDWKPVIVTSHSKEILIAPEGPPVRKVEEIKPVKIITTPKGETVVDMGQNMVGWVRLTVQGQAGDTITLQHAEVLNKAGNFYTKNLRNAKQTDHYILKGNGIEIFEPHFTFHGFRYVKVNGFPGELSLNDLTGIVVHSDMTPIGSFACSKEIVNQLQHNIQWGQKGNFVDVPTDCPQRDERLGWTGDAQVFAPTACFNMDAASFYTKWMKDFIADQQPKGQIPHVIPDVLSHGKDEGNSASAGWADAAVIVPWTVYLSYGDKRILEQQYGCMKGWVDYMKNRAGDSYFWNQDHTFGDWLAFNTTRSDYPGATTDKDFITQAYFGHSTDLLVKIAKILGKQADASEYSQLLKKIKKVFYEEFVTRRDRLSPNTQTAYSLALGFNLLPESEQRAAAKRLAEDVKKFNHITTGFLGAPQICHVLTKFGYNDLAYMLLNRKKYPSWLYPITKGATTIWERWDGIKPDGTFQNPGMNSFNHYAYGAIGEWMYKNMAGLSIDEAHPGYKHTIIAPKPGGGFTRASANTHSMFGDVSSSWKIENGQFSLEINIPPNTSAKVTLPHAELQQVTESGKALDRVQDIQRSIRDGENVMVEVGAGRYHFVYPWPEEKKAAQ